MAEGMTTHRINCPDAETAKVLTEAKWVPLRLEPQPVTNLALRFDYQEQKLSQYDERYNHELRCWSLIQPGDTVLIAEPWVEMGNNPAVPCPVRRCSTKPFDHTILLSEYMNDDACTRREIVEVEGPHQAKSLTTLEIRNLGHRGFVEWERFWKTLHPEGGMDDWAWLVRVK